MESIGKRQCKMTKANTEILNRAMTTVLGKKKVPLPKIQISDMVPYIIVPKNVEDLVIPFNQPIEPHPILFTPLRQFTNTLVQTKRIRIMPRTKPPGEPSRSPVDPKKK